MKIIIRIVRMFRNKIKMAHYCFRVLHKDQILSGPKVCYEAERVSQCPRNNRSPYVSAKEFVRRTKRIKLQ